MVEPPQPALATSLDLASIETLVRSPHPDHEGWLRWTYDTGVAISEFPLDAWIRTETQANDCSYKTASGELIADRGGSRVQGTTEYVRGVTFQGRKADVHKTLISASNVHSKGHVAVVDADGGYIIPYNSSLNNSFRRRRSMNLVQYVCIQRMASTSGYTKIQQHVSTRSNQQLCSMRAKNTRGVSPMDSCPPAQSPEMKLQIMPIESEIVDAGIDDEAIEVQRPNVVVVGRGPTKLEVEHHVASGHAQHRTWCDA